MIKDEMLRELGIKLGEIVRLRKMVLWLWKK